MGKYGAERLMYGTNFPEPAVYADHSRGYQRQWNAFDAWCKEHVSEEEAGLLGGGTCAREPSRYRSHPGCSLLKMAAISLRTGVYQFDTEKLLAEGPAQATMGRL